MTTEIVYTCDRCKKPAASRHENGGFPPLWVVSIHCAPIDSMDRYHKSAYQKAELCPPCVDELRIMKPLLAADVEQPAPTLDDMVRAIVREEQSGE